jgi:tetratricopeptide (TPR) repeat protein
MAIYEKLAGEFPKVGEYQVGLARVRGKLGAILDARSKRKEAEALLRKAIAVPAALVDRGPDRSLVLAELCLARLTLADSLQRRGEDAEAQMLREQALTAAGDPNLFTQLSDRQAVHMANAIAELAGKINQWGKLDEAKKLYAKADELFKKNAATFHKKEGSGPGHKVP